MSIPAHPWMAKYGRYDPERAELPIRWMEDHFRFVNHRRKDAVGQPFKVMRFWAEAIRHVYGWIDQHGNRICNRVYIETPKKNAKSTIAALIAAYSLLGDGEPDSHVVCAAMNKVQADIVYGEVTKLLKTSPTFAALIKEKLISVGESWNNKLVKYEYSEGADLFSGQLYSTSGDANTNAGKNVSALIFDEASTQKHTRLYDILTMGSGLHRGQQIIWIASNAGIIGDSPLAEKLHDEGEAWIKAEPDARDPSFLPILSNLGRDEDWENPDNWVRVNPICEELPEFVEALRAEYRKIRTERDKSEFRRLVCGQWVNAEDRWLDTLAWRQCAGEVPLLPNAVWYGGLDLAARSDFCAYAEVAEVDKKFAVELKFWYPSKRLPELEKRCGKPLGDWAKRGFITLVDGDAIEQEVIIEEIIKRSKTRRIGSIGYDPSMATDVANKLQEAGLTVFPIAQTAYGMHEPCANLEAAVTNRRLLHGDNPVLSWHADCASVKRDGLGRMKPIKPDRMKAVRRIDGIVALIMAMDQINKNGGPSFYASNLPVVFSGATKQ